MFLLAIGDILAEIGKIVDKKYQQYFNLKLVPNMFIWFRISCLIISIKPKDYVAIFLKMGFYKP